MVFKTYQKVSLAKNKMANHKIDMLQIKQLLRLHSNGESKLSISNRLGLSRNTVRKYIGLFHAYQLTFEELSDLSIEEVEDLFETRELLPDSRESVAKNFFPYVSKELKKTGVTRYLLWQEYKEKYPEGYSYAQFCHHYRSWSLRITPSYHMEHKVGDKMFVDYTGKKLSIIDRNTGEIQEVEVFVSILGSSRLTYVEASLSQKKGDFIASLVNTLVFYAGVPAAIVPDNLKSAVKKSHRYEPEIADSLQDFALYHNTTILPARAYHPKDKALVENAVKIVYRRIFAPLRNKQFFDLKSLNEAIFELLEIHNNQPLKKEKISRRALFEEIERSELMPLPEIRYQPKDFSRGTVQKNSHVYLGKDKHYYSVPFAYIGKKVQLMYSQNVVEIYHNERRIAFHERIYAKHSYTTKKEHMPSSYQYLSEWNPNKFISWARTIGEHTEHYIAKVLEKKQHPEQSYKSCTGILSLAKKVGEIRLENACKRAADYGKYNYKSILDIINKGLDQFHEEDFYQENKLPKHRNIRGGKYYE